MLNLSYILKIASKPENITELDCVLNKIKNDFNLDSSTYFNIHLSLTEAINNAIIHGNAEDSTKFVSLRVKKNSDKLIFIVKDEGEGFNVDQLPNPCHKNNIEKCGGRGVFLIKELCDKVKFDDNGSTVKMSFAI